MKFTREKIYETAKKLSNWGRWGDDDQIGTLNNIEPTDIVAAAQLIKKVQFNCHGTATGKMRNDLAVSMVQPLQESFDVTASGC